MPTGATLSATLAFDSPMLLQPNRYHKRTTTMATKPKAPAAKKPAPLVILGPIPGTLRIGIITDLLLASHTSKELTDLLRNRSLGIPKDKAEMAGRLAEWAWANHDRFTLSLGS